MNVTTMALTYVDARQSHVWQQLHTARSYNNFGTHKQLCKGSLKQKKKNKKELWHHVTSVIENSKILKCFHTRTASKRSGRRVHQKKFMNISLHASYWRAVLELRYLDNLISPMKTKTVISNGERNLKRIKARLNSSLQTLQNLLRFCFQANSIEKWLYFKRLLTFNLDF